MEQTDIWGCYILEPLKHRALHALGADDATNMRFLFCGKPAPARGFPFPRESNKSALPCTLISRSLRRISAIASAWSSPTGTVV